MVWVASVHRSTLLVTIGCLTFGIAANGGPWFKSPFPLGYDCYILLPR